MKETSSNARSHERWAHFRFSVIGPLLAAPPSRGQLQAQLQELAAKKWRHPVSGDWVVFGRSTIERWYYKALRAKGGPVEALKRKIRSDHGQHPSVSPKLIELLSEQHRQHPSWSYQLHFDNLAVVVEQQPQAGPMPSYVSLLRCMKSHGLFKRARRGPVHSPGAQAAENRYQAREVRSYESEYVNGLWHLDFHHGSLKPAGDLMDQAVRPEGISFSDWLAAAGAPVPARQVAKHWLLCWGLDISIFDEDHNSRNLASYRPSQFRLPPELDVAELVEFVEDLWRLFEPGTTRRFPVLERFLVRRTLRDTGGPSPSQAALEAIGLDAASAGEWATFLANKDDPLPFRLAEKLAGVDDERCHLQIISRAALLLYLATCAARRLLVNASYDTKTVEFWWKRHGATRGLWATADCPADPVDLWADIEASLRDARQWRLGHAVASSLRSFRRGHTAIVDDVGGFELAGIWGLLP